MLNVDSQGARCMVSPRGTRGRYFNEPAPFIWPSPVPWGIAYVFLDLWGVLLDSDTMQREYGRRIARYMQDRFGGSEATWLEAHRLAWTRYIQEAESTDWGVVPWAATVNRLDARFVTDILDGARVSWRPDDALAFSRELDLRLMATVNARFPDARQAVERLRASGHRVYVATQASDSNARGSLAGGELLDSVDGLFTGSSQDAPKSGRAYWDRILTEVAVPARACVVVDDRIDYLAAARSAGFQALLLDREGVFEGGTVPAFVRATLRNLAGLPHYVDVLAREEPG